MGIGKVLQIYLACTSNMRRAMLRSKAQAMQNRPAGLNTHSSNPPGGSKRLTNSPDGHFKKSMDVRKLAAIRFPFSANTNPSARRFGIHVRLGPKRALTFEPLLVR